MGGTPALLRLGPQLSACVFQLQNQSELRAPTAEKAAFFLDAAIASRRGSQQDCDEEGHRNSHMLFTLHIYQYRMEKSGKGGSKWPRLHPARDPPSRATVTLFVSKVGDAPNVGLGRTPLRLRAACSAN